MNNYTISIKFFCYTKMINITYKNYKLEMDVTNINILFRLFNSLNVLCYYNTNSDSYRPDIVYSNSNFLLYTYKIYFDETWIKLSKYDARINVNFVKTLGYPWKYLAETNYTYIYLYIYIKGIIQNLFIKTNTSAFKEYINRLKNNYALIKQINNTDNYKNNKYIIYN